MENKKDIILLKRFNNDEWRLIFNIWTVLFILYFPKHYKSGWGGGSRAKIKTYNSVKVGGALSKVATPIGIGISAKNVYDAYKSDGNSIGNNTKKAVVSEAGSWAGGIGGAAYGAAIGSAFCPGITGAIIGGIAGGYGGGKGGEKIGEKLFDE